MDSSPNRPNFFIAGAPKCGTTSMYHYLKTHPQVYMPEEKEPHYFASDMPIYQRMTSEAKYLALFRGAPQHHKAIGEASVWYLYSQCALPQIKEFNRESKIIVFFRNPVDFVQSIHAQFAYNSRRNPNFATAWSNLDSRKKLIEQGSFGQQFNRMTSVIAPTDRLVILYEDLKQSPRREYSRVLDFLRLEDDGRTEFNVFNARKVHRSNWLGRFTHKTPSSVLSMWKLIKRATGIKNVGLMERIAEFNTKSTPNNGITNELRLSVHNAFANDISWLGEQIGRDLSHWK